MGTSFRFYLFSLLLAIFAITSPSCRSKKKLPVSKNLEDSTLVNPNCKMDFKTAKTLTKLLKKNEFDFRWISCKFELSDHKDCAARGLNSAGFAAVDVGGQPSTTVRFKE